MKTLFLKLALSFIAFNLACLGSLPAVSGGETEEAVIVTHVPPPDGAFRELYVKENAVLGYDSKANAASRVTIGRDLFPSPLPGIRMSRADLEIGGDVKITGPLQVLPNQNSGTKEGYVLTTVNGIDRAASSNRTGVALWEPAAAAHAWFDPEVAVFSLQKTTTPPLPAEDKWLTVTHALLDKYPGRMAILRVHTTAANVDIRAVGSSTNNPGDPAGTPPDPPVNFSDPYKTHWSTTVTRSKAAEDDWNTALVTLDERGDFQLVYHTYGDFNITIWVLGVL